MKPVLYRKSALLLLCLLPTFLVGCSLLESNQPPAPVYGESYPPYPQPSKKNKLSKPTKKPKPVVAPEPQAEPEVVQTVPLGESRAAPTITPLDSPQATPLTFEQEQALLQQELQKEASEQAAAQTAATPTPQTGTVPAPAILEPPPPPPPPPAEPPPPPFVPLESFAPFSPVVNSLVSAANQYGKANPELAASTIERAVRIEPRNAALLYKLALLRLKQKKPELAEDLAKKSISLAADGQLKKHGWLLIAEARERRADKKGAKQARTMAEKF